MWSAELLSASARSALSPLEKYMRSEANNASLLIFFALRAQADRMSALPALVLLLLLDVIPMHPGVGLRAIASFEEDIFLGLAGHHLDP
jgi:hypothetical protein